MLFNYHVILVHVIFVILLLALAVLVDLVVVIVVVVVVVVALLALVLVVVLVAVLVVCVLLLFLFLLFVGSCSSLLVSWPPGLMAFGHLAPWLKAHQSQRGSSCSHRVPTLGCSGGA